MKIVLALITILALASATVGDTFASFCDSETSFDNYIETGSLDLLVAEACDDWEGSDYRHDLPWGTGLEPCFWVPEVEVVECQTYTSYLLLWNAGCLDGTAYLHLKDISANPDTLPYKTDVTISYDVDGDENLELIKSGTLASLTCTYWELGPLPAEEIRRLSIELHFFPSEPDDLCLTFNTIFGLVQAEGSFSDTEECSGFFGDACSESGGTPGFWSGPGAVNLYGKDKIVGWFTTIVGSSKWFTGVPITGVVDLDYEIMRDILKASAGNDYEEMVAKFRSQYLATRLNAEAGRLGLDTSHDISGIPNAESYFGSGTLAQIIATIESKAVGPIFTAPPNEDQMEIMKDVCDFLNNP